MLVLLLLLVSRLITRSRLMIFHSKVFSSDKAFKGVVVNRICHSINKGSFWITSITFNDKLILVLTVLDWSKYWFCFELLYKNYGFWSYYFPSDSSISHDGFTASYIMLNSSTFCGGNFYTQTGVIRSPGWPAEYTHSRYTFIHIYLDSRYTFVHICQDSRYTFTEDQF